MARLMTHPLTRSRPSAVSISAQAAVTADVAARSSEFGGNTCCDESDEGRGDEPHDWLLSVVGSLRLRVMWAGRLPTLSKDRALAWRASSGEPAFVAGPPGPSSHCRRTYCPFPTPVSDALPSCFRAVTMSGVWFLGLAPNGLESLWPPRRPQTVTVPPMAAEPLLGHIAFTTSTWGTIGQWASVTLALCALTSTLYIIRRDAKLRRRTQARKVAFYVVTSDRLAREVEGKQKHWYDLIVENLSDEPVYSVQYVMARGPRILDGLTTHPVLMPKAQVSWRRGTYPRPLDWKNRRRYSGPSHTVDVLFRDNGGTHWRRDLEGNLREQGSYLRWRLRRFPNGANPKVFLEGRRVRENNRRVMQERRLRQAERERERATGGGGNAPTDSP